MSDEEIEIDEIEETGEDEIMNEGGEDGAEGGEGEGDENILENTYYSAKGSLEEDLEEALESFQTVLDMEEEKGEWGFKSLKQMIKALLKAQRYEELVKRYKQLLEYTTVVNKNDSEKAINKILNMTSNLQNQKVLDQLYTVTLDAMKSSKNEKLWFNVKSRQAQLFLTAKDYGRLGKVLAELKQVCSLPDGSENPAKASSLLEVFVLEIQMYTEQNELKKLKALYEKCSKILSGGAVVLAPKTTAIIRECGGKMYMREKQWKQANEDFFEAFKSYDEAGNVRRINCLKYLVLANMLSNSDINPFDAPEAKPYKNHTEIVAMNNLVSAFQHANINQFEKILKENKQTIAEDSFIQEYLPDLLKGVRTKVLLQIIQPYTRIRMAFLAKELNIAVTQVESLAVDLILDQQLDGHIDQMKEVIELGGDKSAYSRYKALSDWSRRLQDIHTAVLNKVY